MKLRGKCLLNIQLGLIKDEEFLNNNIEFCIFESILVWKIEINKIMECYVLGDIYKEQLII